MSATAEKATVLMVDDRPEKLLALEAVLSDLPLTLVRAHSGREALRCLLNQEFAAILLDINMPGMDGFETASLIRQRKSSEHTPIIFVTAYHDEVFMSRGYSLGAVDYILQPVVPEILRSKVCVFVDLYMKNRQVLEHARLQQHRAAQLQKLASASVAINAATSMARTLQFITETARDVIGSHQAITLFRMDVDGIVQDGKAPVPANSQARGYSSFTDKYSDWRDRPLRLDLAAQSVVANSRTPTCLSALQLKTHPDHALIKKLEAAGEIPPVVGMLAAPLIGREGRNMGVIYLSDKPGEFNADDEAILLQLSQMAVVAIENHLSVEAREANRAKDQFIAVLSHELRTPLTPVLATVASLQSDKRIPQDLQEDLKVIRRNVELEARLIDDLLDLTRISKGKIELNLEVIDLNELLREAANICRSDVEEKSIDLALELHARHKFVKGDATRLQQVFWNLLKNAVKFTPAQGRIVIETFDNADGTVCARVADNGIGMESEILPRIFNAFEQGRSAITRQFGGLGLGLAISKALVEQHRGTLLASSDGPGKGSAFTVAMPVTTELPQTAYHTPRLVATGPSRQIRVALVEDHRDTARVMSKLLRANGYAVDTAASLTEAFALLKANKYDVLVSDIGLPDGSGLDLMRQARANQSLSGIALSGFGMEHDIRRSKEAGFTEHLTKPLNFQLLIDAIERLTLTPEPAMAAPLVG
jgi:signal transduction histidine kinase/DNA-binding response OmpR family regulator